MRYYLKIIVVTLIAFFTAYNLIPTINLGNNQNNIIIVIAGLLITSLVIRPIFALVLLPINLLTFGLISLILNCALLFAFTKYLAGFTIASYNFSGINFQGIIITPISFNQIETILIIALIITLTQKILMLIFE